MKPRRAAPATIRVWDAPVRVLHWTLAVSVAFSALGLVMLFGVHEPAGYVALAAVLARALWGVVGTRFARFTQFMRGPRASWRYAGSVLQRREPRHLGHNPLGGWMVVALMLCVAGLALTGWLYTTDALYADETVERVHRALAWALLGLVVTHVGGVIFTSLRHRENLVAAMFSGRKRAPGPTDIG
jgi:cytochrome b